MTLREFFTPTSIVFLAALLAVTIAGYLLIPVDAVLPIHWGFDGRVDAIAPRNPSLVLVPCITILIWAIFYVLMRYGSHARTEGGRHLLLVARTGITGVLLIVQSAMVGVGLGVAIDMTRVMSITVALLLVGLGNAVPKSQPNWFAGIRIPSTLRDPANWQATHRLAGWLLMAGGAGLLVAGLILPSGLPLIIAIGVAALAPLIIGTLYSLALARRPRA